MVGKQEALIYIEEENKIEAEFMSRSFVNPVVKNRAYINALGAELVMKYLAAEGVDVSDLHNLHSISKILEKVDISDILLPNIHIDVRVVFDEDKIFIPKSHFKLEITPDIYVVLKLVEDFSRVEFLGYFEPKLLNLKNQNSDYYFIEKEKLSSPDSLVKFVKDFNGNTSRGISQEDMLRARELSIAMADHNISDEDQKELIDLLLQSDELRDSVLEFDNFETLSYSVGHILDPNSSLAEGSTPLAETGSETGSESESGSSSETEEETSTEEEELPLSNEDINLSLDSDEDMVLDESFFDDNALQGEDSNTQDAGDEISSTVNETLDTLSTGVSEDLAVDDVVTTEEFFEPLEIDPNGEDLLLDNEPSSLDEGEQKETNSDNNTLENAIGGAIKKSLEKTAQAGVTGAIAAGAAAAGAGAAEAMSASAASADAIKLAGVSGELVNELVNKNLESQQVHLDRIDYAKTTTNANEVPENIAAYDLSMAKMEADLEAEASGKFDSPKDLSELKKVDQNTIGYGENIEQEVVDLNDMESVELAPIEENNDGIVDFNKLAHVDSPTTPVADLDEKMHVESPVDLDFQNMSSYTINEDGTSAFDNLDINLAPEEHDEHLVDFGMTPPKIVIDNTNNTPVDFSNQSKSNDETTTLEEDFTEEFFNNSNEQSNNSNDENNNSSESETSTTDVADTTIDGLSIDDDTSSTVLTDDLDVVLEDDSLSLDGADNSLLSGAGEDIDIANGLNEDLSLGDLDNSLSISEEPTIDDVTLDEPTITEPISQEPVLDNIVEETSILEASQPEEIIPDDFTLEDDASDAIIDENVPIEDITTPTGDETSTADSLDIDLTESPDAMSEEMSDDLADNGITSLSEENDVASVENVLGGIDDQSLSQEETTSPSVEIQNVQDDTEQDWMNDTNYDNLQDVEITPASDDIDLGDVQNQDGVNNVEDDGFITEPQPDEKVFNAIENSTVISDTTFKVGEIPIDINNPEAPELEGPEQLENLYDENNTVPGSALLQNPGRLGSARPSGKVGLGIGLGIVGVILTIVIVGIIGFSVSKMIKQPKDETPQPITDGSTPTSPDNGVSDANTLNVDQSSVVNMDNTAAPAATPVTPTASTTQNVQQPKAETVTKQVPVTKPKNAIPASSFIEVSKLSWEVPDYISYNSHFRQYFQAVGKSLKLSLTSDLLLATEYSYSDQVRVSILFDKEGNFKDAKILLSSGSNQIDKIVLQTVNQTLKVLKAPHSVGNDESTTVILKIYF